MLAVALAGCGGGGSDGSGDASGRTTLTPAAALGEKIFNDSTLSASGRMSCATCHQADAAHATVYLEVRTDNAVARALYISEGFAVVGLRKRYYAPSGADAHTMRRDPR